MALKRTQIVETAPASKKGSKLPELATKGVARYVEIEAQFKVLDAELKLAKVSLAKAGSTGVIKHNVSAVEPVSSVRLYETVKVEETGELARSEVVVSFQDRYSVANPEAAESLFEAMGKDVNSYVHETAAVKFNSDIFIVNGEFNQKVFDVINASVKKAVEDLVKKKVLPEGAVSPLATSTVVVPKPDFHARRFKDFTVEENESITEVLKNTVTIKVS
jgi:hypothetical protein